MRWSVSIGALVLAMTAGCEESGNPSPPQPAAPAQPPAATAQNAAGFAVDDPSQLPTDSPPSAGESGQTMVREQAHAGVGQQGRNYPTGPVSTPVAAGFLARDRLALDIQIPHAMQLYKAEHGYAPRNQNEFMQKIIRDNMIHLPELPPGHHYVYDPQQERLLVEHLQNQ